MSSSPRSRACIMKQGDQGERAMGVSELFQREDFHSRHGKAYLFNTVVNVTIGPLEERMMTSGLHTIADIFCNCCGRIVGWKYESAWEKNQKYKEGKFILERAKMVDGDGTDFFLDAHQTSSGTDDV